jgi:hypothetical protein
MGSKTHRRRNLQTNNSFVLRSLRARNVLQRNAAYRIMPHQSRLGAASPLLVLADSA